MLVRVTLNLADNAYSSQVRQQVARIVSLPSVTVQPGWQMPRLQPGAGGLAPGTPGNPAVPGNPVPGNPGFIPSPVPGPGGRRN